MISVKVHDNNVGKAISKLKNILVNAVFTKSQAEITKCSFNISSSSKNTPMGLSLLLIEEVILHI